MEWAGVDISDFSEIKNWLERINDRPAVAEGLNVPEPFKMKEMMKSKDGEEEYAKAAFELGYEGAGERPSDAWIE